MSKRHRLPEDILNEILTRLPVRSLVRFTAVSKSWFFLITSPAFLSAHLRRSRCNGNSAGNLLLLRHLENSSIKEKYEILEETDHQTLNPIGSPELPPAFACEDFRVVGCCNGVVCLSDAWYTDLCCTYLWNPSIQKLKPLPPPSIRPAGHIKSILGFGVNPDCDGDLKVVRAVYKRKGDYGQIPNGSPHVEIYSLSTGKWRRISRVGVKLGAIEVRGWSQTFLHGAVHWIGRKWRYKAGSKCCITVFSMADEVFSEIKLPNELAKWSEFYLNVMAFDESIAVAKYAATRNHRMICELWVMKEYGVVKSWCRLYRIELVGHLDRVVGFRKNGDILISTDDSQLVSYCPTTKVFHELGIYGTNRSFYVAKYLESLVLLQEKSCDFDVLSKEMTSMSI